MSRSRLFMTMLTGQSCCALVAQVLMNNLNEEQISNM
jgi:hypothetical protein